MTPVLKCATWNVHRAKGRDGVSDPSRIENAICNHIAPHSPDILALQEADTECPPHAGILDIARITKETGLVSVHIHGSLRWGPESDGFLGTILFVRPTFEITDSQVIDLPGHCHRGAVSVEMMTAGYRLRIISMHLSLTQVLRAVQMRTIGQFITRRVKMQTLILGDLNEWRPWGGLALSERLIGRRFYGPAQRSFPTKTPLLPLDRILTDHPHSISSAATLSTPATEQASDHRPVFAHLTLRTPS